MSPWLNAINQLPNMPTMKPAIPRNAKVGSVRSAAWTDEMHDFLERNYPIMSNNELAIELRKGKGTIRAKADSMGLSKIFGRSKPPLPIYRDVIHRWKEGQSHAMMIMVLGVTEDEINRAIQHYERYGL